jgi:hypothetical protein
MIEAQASVRREWKATAFQQSSKAFESGTYACLRHVAYRNLGFPKVASRLNLLEIEDNLRNWTEGMISVSQDTNARN